MNLPSRTSALRPKPASTDFLILRPTQPKKVLTRAIQPHRGLKGFLAQAEKLGFQVTPKDELEQELAMSIAKRLVPRLGSNLYQTASYTLEGYTLNAVRALAANVKECEAPNCTRSEVVWHLPSVPTIRRLLADLMSALPNLSAGISRGQMAPSESCIRVLATIIPPLVLTWWQPPTGRGRLQVQFMYVLVMGDGDIHMPKDQRVARLLSLCFSPDRIRHREVPM